MSETLVEWCERNDPKDEMRWKDPLIAQVNFVGRTLGALFGSTIGEEFKLAVPEVVSTHTSKSILCPVSKFELPWGQVILRNNFFNWNVAVIANRDIEFDWQELIDEHHGGYLFLEGMESFHRPPYPESKREFCFCVSGDFPCYGALLLIKLAADKQNRTPHFLPGEPPWPESSSIKSCTRVPNRTSRTKSDR